MLRVAILVLVAAFLMAFWHGGSPAPPSNLVATCPTYDTTALSALQSSVISNCLVTTGPHDEILVTVTGQISCADHMLASLTLIRTTIKPIFGSSFIAQIASGIMTVSSMVTPFPQFGIDIGTLLSDGQNGAGIPSTGSIGSTLTVTGQVSGVTSGVGTYTVSPSSVTVASEQMWALYNYSLKPPSSGQMRELAENSSCTGGNNYITTIQGVADATFSPNTSMYVILSLTSEANPTVKSSSWQNGQINAMALGQ